MVKTVRICLSIEIHSFEQIAGRAVGHSGALQAMSGEKPMSPSDRRYACQAKL